MAERTLGQLSLADSLVQAFGPKNARLERIGGLVDWSAVAALLAPLRQGRMGAPAYPSLVLLKALLLQQWYGLSDEALEEAILDRLSFRRFMGISLSDPIPDHSTLWRFREALGRAGLAEQLFDLITAQIEASGFVLKQGTLIDASLIPSKVNPPAPPYGPMPADDAGKEASRLIKAHADPDAAWTAFEGKKRVLGYKVHVGMDQGSRIVRKLVVTPANVNETTPADGLISGDEGRVFADKAYDTFARRVELPARGIKNGIMRRARRFHPLSRWEVLRNKLLRKYRGPIEPLFALLKHVYRFVRAPYFGLVRNKAGLNLACLAMNLKRWANA